MAEDIFVVKGLDGRRVLKGEISVRGSKNAALPALAASVLFDKPPVFENVPEIKDIEVMREILASSEFKKGELSRDCAKRMRASVILIGPLLALHGSARFPHPGGCVIGARPIDFFVEGFKKMGASYSEDGGDYFLRAPKDGLRGADIFFPNPSVTGTETFMLAAIRASGKTILRNAAMEPEVVFLANTLKKGGADISGEGTPTIEIVGSKKLLRAPKTAIKIIPDRIEAGSFLILAALAGKDISITDCEPEHIRIVIELLRSAGVEIEEGARTLRVRAPITKLGAQHSLYKSFSIKTHEYPGFPTDLQAPLAVFLTQAEGESLIHETIFEGRMAYAKDISSMGADITQWDAHRATVKGPTPLKGKELYGPDLRAGLAYLIAAIIARGDSVIHNVSFIDRGHERLEERLSKIGVNIKRENL